MSNGSAVKIIPPLRDAIRAIIRSPASFAAPVLLISIGIGAVTTIFAFLDALLLRPLPVRDPGNLVQIVQVFPNPSLRAQPYLPFELYQRLADGSATLFDVMGQSESSVTLENGADREQAYVQAVTDNFSTALGVDAAPGTFFRSGDAPAAVLSYEGWTRYFSRDPAAIGRIVRLGGYPFQIVGVTPREFNGTNADITPAVRVPYRFIKQLDGTDQDFLEIIARLKPGVPLEDAQKEVTAVWKSLPGATPGALANSRIELRSISRGASYLREQFRTALIALMVGTALLLLMVCSNVGGLLLARSAAHSKETAVRLALGATRVKIVGQCVLESLLATCLGGAAGAAFAYAGLPLLMRRMPQLPLNSVELRTFSVDVHIGVRVIGFALAACGITAILSALAPAWRASRDDLYAVIKGTMSDIRHRRLQAVLCSVQIALCLVLITSAGLMIRTLSNLATLDPGFDRKRIATFSIDPRPGKYDSRQTWMLQQRLLREAQSIAGVETAAIGAPLMRGIGIITGIALPGQADQVTSLNFVTPEYFDLMKMRVVAGRPFLSTDKPDTKPQPVVVNEEFVRHFLGGGNAVGSRLGQDGGREIIGVVNDSYYRSLREAPPPIVYISDFGPNAYPRPFVLYIRTQNSPEAMVEPMRRVLQSVDSKIPIHEASTITAEIERSLWRERFIAGLASGFGAFALLLSAIGLYGALAYFVAQRQRELGLRLALGASTLHVIETVLRRIAPVMIGGLAGGLAVYFITGRWMQTLFFGVGFADPVFMGGAAVMLMATAAGAAAVPIYRALHLDAASVLKQE